MDDSSRICIVEFVIVRLPKGTGSHSPIVDVGAMFHTARSGGMLRGLLQQDTAYAPEQSHPSRAPAFGRARMSRWSRSEPTWCAGGVRRMTRISR
jgi:hypothetical protein